MKALTHELENLKDELMAHVPRALEALVTAGRLSVADPLDAVGISYATVGNGSVFHWLSVRTVERRAVLESYPDRAYLPWLVAEYEICDDLSDLVDVAPSYTRICERLTQLVVHATDAKDEDDKDYTEFDMLEEAVRNVARSLTKNWNSDTVPSVKHPIFFAINWYQDRPGDSVARSVEPEDLTRAGLAIPRMEENG